MNARLCFPQGELCAIPTYDGAGECTHPSIVDSVAVLGHPWHGFRFWMAFTPYPGNSTRRFRLENPSIVASNDGRQWALPPRVTNPIVPAPGFLDVRSSLGAGVPPRRLLCYLRGTLLHRSYNADPALYLAPNGVMYMAHVHSLSGIGHDELVLVVSSDGWRSVERRGVLVRSCQEPGTYEINVPSIVETAAGLLQLYYGYVPTDTDGRPRFDRVGIRRRSGADLDTLGAATTMTIRYPPGQRLWHHELRRHPDGRLICLGSFTPDTGSKHSMRWPPMLSLYYGECADDHTLVFDDRPILQPSDNGWDSQCIYKPSFLIRAGELDDTFQLWYSAQHAQVRRWHIGLTEQQLVREHTL